MQKTLLLNLLKRNPKAIFVGSLGTISYDLRCILEESKAPLGITAYLIPGAMGCTLGVALGLALNVKKKVILIIGDGSLLMKLGSISTILKYKPKNLEVHVIQNDTYASTGNQDINFKYVKSMIPSYFKIHEDIRK